MYQDSVHLLQPTVVVLRVCGVCPTALRRLHIPTCNKIYGLFLALAPFLFVPIFLINIYEIFNDITAFIFAINVIMCLIRHLVILLCTFLSSEDLIRFFMIMESAQQSLFSLNIRQPPYPTKKSQISWLLVMFAPILITFVILIFHRHVSLAFLTLLYNMVSTGALCKMGALMQLINDKYYLLNWHLDDLNNRWPVFLPRPPDVSFRELPCVAEWRSTKFVVPSQDHRIITADKVREFNKAHLKLFYAYKTLTSMFSLTGLTIFLATSTELVVDCFNLFSKSVQIISIPVLFISIVKNILTAGVVLMLASKIQEKNHKAALLVHDILDEEGHSPEVVQELEVFSQSLLHRMANFSAGGFVDLELKLFTRMASVLAPVILFLVQNDNRPRAGRKDLPRT